MHKTLISALAAAAFLAFAGTASADETTGRIAGIDPDEQTITLENGMTFALSEEIDIEGLAPGEEVKVTYESQDGVNLATDVERPEN